MLLLLQLPHNTLLRLAVPLSVGLRESQVPEAGPELEPPTFSSQVLDYRCELPYKFCFSV